MKYWKLAADEKAQARPHRVLNEFPLLYFGWSFFLLGLLPSLMYSEARASDIQVPPEQNVHTLKNVKGLGATRNNALLSPFRIFDTKDGLPQTTVHAMATGPDGRIYVGTFDGLSRFDGVNFTRLPLQQPELPAAVKIITVVGAQIWIGTDELGLWLGDGEHWRKIALMVPENGANTSVGKSALLGITAIRPRNNNGVWVSTTAGLFSCVESACVFQQSTAGLDVKDVLEGQYHGQPVLWVAAQDQGVLAFGLAQDGKLGAIKAKFSRAEGLVSSSIRVLKNWQGALWMGSAWGLSRLRQNDSGPDEMTSWGRDDSAFSEGVTDLLPSLDAQHHPILLAATFGGGLIQIDEKDHWSALTVAQGLPENRLLSLLQSPDGGPVWIGTASSGVVRANPGGWVAYTERNGLPHRSLIGMGRARFPDGIESYWLGTISGAVRLENGRWRPFLPAAITDRPLYDIAPRAGGGLWLATDLGLFSWDGKRLTNYSPDNADMPNFTVLDIEQRGKTGELWLALRSGLVSIVGDKVSTIKGRAGALNLLYVDGLAGGSMFVAEDEGLRWIKGDGTEKLIEPPCLAHPSIYSMALAATAIGKPVELWVGGRAGITRLRFNDTGGIEIQCNQVDAAALGSNWIYEVKFDANGDLYAFGYNGAMRLHVAAFNALDSNRADAVSPEDVLKKLEIEHFMLVDGLPDLEFNRGVMLDQDGRIWASNVGGAAIFDPKSQATSISNAPFIFTSLRVANDANLSAKLVLGDELPNGAELLTSYRLLSYSRESKIRYRTQLLGLEPRMSEWTPAATRNFPRLPGGHYVLKVWAKDAMNHPYGPIELKFSVAQPWWRNPWLILLAAAALIYSGASLGRFRADFLKRKALKLAQSLESQVRSRTQELADANVQLENLALTDPLTGCYNRRYFYERYLNAHQSRDVLVILLDIDHFKKINDEFGHAGGDAVLVQFALRLQQIGAPVFRMGGEEFMILEFSKSSTEQQVLIDRTLKLISEQEFDLGVKQIRVTASIGAACFLHHPGSHQSEQADESERLERVIGIADAALYQAKEAGRNRAVLAEVSREIAAPLGTQISKTRGRFRE